MPVLSTRGRERAANQFSSPLVVGLGLRGARKWEPDTSWWRDRAPGGLAKGRWGWVDAWVLPCLGGGFVGLGRGMRMGLPLSPRRPRPAPIPGGERRRPSPAHFRSGSRPRPFLSLCCSQGAEPGHKKARAPDRSLQERWRLPECGRKWPAWLRARTKAKRK